MNKSIDGIILLDKASGITSAKAIAQVKRRLNVDKIGHAGTLDPLATGLLVCLIGKATKLASVVQHGTKLYSGSFRFGVTSSTDDIQGELFESPSEVPSLSKLKQIASRYIGEIEQVPPQVSAIKVSGQRAYDLARKGVCFALSPRKVTVSKFDLWSAYSETESGREFNFLVECSSGTYIRSLARDLGSEAGCGAIVASLRREISAPFNVCNAKTLEQLCVADILSLSNISTEGGLCHLL